MDSEDGQKGNMNQSWVGGRNRGVRWTEGGRREEEVGWRGWERSEGGAEGKGGVT